MVRRFKFTNEIGEVFDLMDINKYAFLANPSGLGYSSSTTFYQVGDNYVLDNQNLNQSTIGGTLHFKTYDNYRNLIDYIERSKNIRFYYSVPTQYGYEDFYKEVVVENISKTQKNTYGLLECEITLKGKNKWLKEEILITKISSDRKDSKWEFSWNPSLIEYNSNLIVYNNVSHSEAGFKVEIHGEMLNPKFKIEDDDGNVLIDINYTGRLEENETIIYSTLDTDLRYEIVKGDVRQNLFGTLPLDQANFNKLKKGINKIKINADTILKKVEIKIYPEFKSV